MHPFVSDLAQRLLTLNKRHQKHDISSILARINFPKQPCVLDFGCGTGLFARFLQGLGLKYVGYDVDEKLIAYAGKRSPGVTFTTSLDVATASGPYDLILVNCCFHHIPDEECQNILRWFATILQPSGHVLFIDILRPAQRISAMHDFFMCMEQGKHVRSREENLALLSGSVHALEPTVTRSYCFGLRSRFNGFCNDVLTCVLRAQA